MKAIACTAVLAATGLLAVSACVHDGDSSPSTSEMDMDTATLNESRGANSDQILDVIGQAARSTPQSQIESVVQAAAVDMASASAVSTAFDGSDLTMTVSRDDGSALTLDTGSDASDASDPVVSPIAGHSAQSWGVLKIDTDGISIARATVTANASDAADYLAVGYWMHIAGDATELNFTGAEIGAFVDGPELMAPPANLPTQGMASYYGPASGAYAVLHGTGEGGTPGSTESGEFISTVELTADFDANTIGGCVGCRDGVALIGVLLDADTGESSDVDFEDSGYRLHLDSTSFNSDGTFQSQQMRLEHTVIAITAQTGAWGGQFSNIADGEGDPRLVAGTFGAEATSSGGSEGAFLGSFVGTKE